MERYKDMKTRKLVNVKMIRNLVFFVLLIIFTFWYIFKDQDLRELRNCLQSANIFYVFIGFLLMFGSYLTESINVKGKADDNNEFDYTGSLTLLDGKLTVVYEKGQVTTNSTAGGSSAYQVGALEEVNKTITLTKVVDNS